MRLDRSNMKQSLSALLGHKDIFKSPSREATRRGLSMHTGGGFAPITKQPGLCQRGYACARIRGRVALHSGRGDESVSMRIVSAPRRCRVLEAGAAPGLKPWSATPGANNRAML